MSGCTTTAVPRSAVPQSKHHEPPTREAFEIAIFCALPTEASPMTVLLDPEYETSGSTYKKSVHDTNTYTTGRIGGHDVVVVHMPGPGTTSAAGAASQLKSTFKNIILCFVVGVCGGVPSPSQGVNILLGDVIISTGVVQTDMGRQYPEGFRRKTRVEDTLGRACPSVRALLKKLQTDPVTERLREKTTNTIAELTENDKFAKARYPGPAKDVLYPAEYRHKHRDRPCQICDRCHKQDDPVCDVARESSCDKVGCKTASHDSWNRTDRCLGVAGDDVGKGNGGLRPECRMNIHFGPITSCNQVMMSGRHRDKIANAEGIIGFEMESAGTWEVIPTIAIKAVADYADSHKSKEWQPYSAAVAAACVKAVLEEWRGTDRALDDKTNRTGLSMAVSLGSNCQASQGTRGQVVNQTVFYGPVHYHGQVGSFDEVISKGDEAIEGSEQLIERSQQQRERQYDHFKSLMEIVESLGSYFILLLSGAGVGLSRINQAFVAYTCRLAITETDLYSGINQTKDIRESLNKSNDEIQGAVSLVDLMLYEVFYLLSRPDCATLNSNIDSADSEDPQTTCEQRVNETEAGETAGYYAHQSTNGDTSPLLEWPTNKATESLAAQGEEAESSSAQTFCPSSIENQQSETISVLKQQLAALKNEKYQLMMQLERVELEAEAQKETQESLERQLKDTEDKRRVAEKEVNEQRSRWCNIL